MDKQAILSVGLFGGVCASTICAHFERVVVLSGTKYLVDLLLMSLMACFVHCYFHFPDFDQWVSSHHIFHI